MGRTLPGLEHWDHVGHELERAAQHNPGSMRGSLHAKLQEEKYLKSHFGSQVKATKDQGVSVPIFSLHPFSCC